MPSQQARSQMLDLRGNFKYGKKNINCSLGCDQTEDQPHILICPAINAPIETNDYSDFYGNDPIKVEAITKKLMKRFLEFKATVHRRTQPSAAATSNDNDNIDIINVA